MLLEGMTKEERVSSAIRLAKQIGKEYLVHDGIVYMVEMDKESLKNCPEVHSVLFYNPITSEKVILTQLSREGLLGVSLSDNTFKGALPKDLLMKAFAKISHKIAVECLSILSEVIGRYDDNTTNA